MVRSINKAMESVTGWVEILGLKTKLRNGEVISDSRRQNYYWEEASGDTSEEEGEKATIIYL